VVEPIEGQFHFEHFIPEGGTVDYKEHPWHATLISNNEFICGASLISRTAAITGINNFYLTNRLKTIIRRKQRLLCCIASTQ